LTSEFFDSDISFFFSHFWEHNEGMKSGLLKNLVDFLSKIFWIDKNKCLCHLTSFKNLLNKFKFFSVLAFKNKLFHMRKL
jgi:hypothetical protein